MWGAAPILFRCGRCSGTLVWARPAAGNPRGSRSSCILPPRVAVPSGGGGSPRLRGSGGPLLWLPSWEGCGGGGGGGAPPRPPAPSGVGLPSVAPGVPPRGILVPWGLPPTGHCGGGGGKGGEPPRPGSRPSLPRAWGPGLCVLLCALCLDLTNPGWGARCTCVPLGSGFGCAPPLLAGVLRRVCVCVCAPRVPCHPWLGCAVYVCLLGLGFRLRPATPGWGVGVCVCLCARSSCKN